MNKTDRLNQDYALFGFTVVSTSGHRIDPRRTTLLNEGPYKMTIEDEIIEVVDEIADDINPERIDREAERLEITAADLMDRVRQEVLSRI